MFRTADLSACRLKTFISLVLWMIAFCLVAHFFLEDVSLHRAANSASQGQYGVRIAFDEMEHQDDLAITTGLPASIPHNNSPAVTAWSIRLERQPAFPIRIPPKIA